MFHDMKQKITTIIFDWAGVFCSPGELFSSKRLLKATGEDVDAMIDRINKHGIQNDYYRGKITSNQFWKNVFKEYNLKGFTASEMNDAYLASYKPYPDILAIPKKLKSRFKVALLSNLTEEMMRHIIKTHELRKKFHAMFFSNRESRLKPEPEMFHLALRKLGSKPKETLFIDDTKSNLIAAKKIGMRTLHSTTPNKLIADLRKIKLL